MSFDSFWKFFTYIFRIFKRDKRPEYTKLEDDEFEIEFGKLSDCSTPVYEFILIGD